MLDTLRGSYRMESAPEPLEVTLEADPETITAEKARAWIAAGFNRISLGAQSFDDRELQAAGRMHRRADIFSAVEFLRGAGFGNISMDLIAGLPHQTRDSWEKSVSELLQIRPEHASVYMLEIDKDSPWAGNRWREGAATARVRFPMTIQLPIFTSRRASGWMRPATRTTKFRTGACPGESRGTI
jgi:coproporphyrinogen III oxidase-like Fe-S oxidoreductase